MNKKPHADHIYIEALLKNDSRVLSKLYEKFSHKIVAYVRKNNGNADEWYSGLIAPAITLATHMEVGLLSPNIEWSKLFQI